MESVIHSVLACRVVLHIREKARSVAEVPLTWQDGFGEGSDFPSGMPQEA